LLHQGSIHNAFIEQAFMLMIMLFEMGPAGLMNRAGAGMALISIGLQNSNGIFHVMGSHQHHIMGKLPLCIELFRDKNLRRFPDGLCFVFGF